MSLLSVVQQRPAVEAEVTSLTFRLAVIFIDEANVHWARDEDDQERHTITRNPLLDLVFAPTTHPTRKLESQRYYDLYWTELDRPGTWKDMYVSSPPVRVLVCSLQPWIKRPLGGLTSLKVHSRDGAGVKMGDVAEAIRPFKGESARVLVVFKGMELWREGATGSYEDQAD